GLIVFVDGADEQIKAMKVPEERSAVNFGLTKSSLKYGLLEYTDVLNPAKYGNANEKIIVNASVKAYKWDGSNIVQAGGTKTLDGKEISANGETQQLGASINSLNFDSTAQFFVAANTTDSRETQVLFKNGDAYSNVAFDRQAQVVAIPPNYSATGRRIELAFAVDTSRSAGALWPTLCDKIKTAKEKLTGLGFEVSTIIYPIGTAQAALPVDWTQNCAELNVDAAGTSGTWTAPSAQKIREPAQNNGGFDHTIEAWGPAVTEILEKEPSGKEYTIMVVVVGDNDPTGKRCQTNYEHVDCVSQWRAGADDTVLSGNIENEMPFVNAAIGSAKARNAKLFFFYGYPINHNTVDQYTEPGASNALNDVYELYKKAADATNGGAESFGGDSGGERLSQMLMASLLPKATQKFQLRLDSGAQAECGLEGKTGSTGGSGSVPRVKFTWKWIEDAEAKTGLSMTNCDYENENWIYCDQAQISIELLKKIRQISEWGNETGGIAAHAPEIDKYKNFDAYLIEDTYSQKFRQDFVNYYQGESLLDAPEWFSKKGTTEPWAAYFTDSSNFVIKVDDTGNPAAQAYSIIGTDVANKTIKAGLYHVTVLFAFQANKDWQFFDSSGNAIAKTEIFLKKISDPEYNSPFYHMAIDGKIGMENPGSGRFASAYGTKFNVTSEGELVLGDGILVNDLTQGSKVVDVSQIRDFYAVNSDMRGMLLRVNYDPATFQPREIKFLPNRAMPVAGKVVASSGKGILDYYITDGSSTMSGLNAMTKWTGFGSQNPSGSCQDISGNALPLDMPDKKLNPYLTDITGCKDPTYGLRWEPVVVADKTEMYLDAMLFVPKEISLALKKGCPKASVPSEFYALDSGSGKKTLNSETGALDISDSPFSIEQIAQVFDGVKGKMVCVDGTTTGQVDFFWNGSAITGALVEKINLPDETGCGS
ncbi:MAG: hypothetical protein PHH08_05170, partial [Candidatus ainarchaeum sp.]|nr:hypothetical protein [Candidatus ainarchaeum sp.]